MAQSRITLAWNGGVSGFGRQVTINISRDSQSYRHQLLFYFDNMIQTTQYGVTNMATFTVPNEWMSQIPANTQAEFKVVCYTYNGSGELTNPGTFIGQDTETVTLYVPETVVPTISGVTLSDPEGYLAEYGAYVTGHSHIRAVITASGASGSTIKSYKVSIGTTYDTSSQFGTVEIYDLNISGTVNVTATATDTRNRSAQVTQQITAASYVNPDLSLSSASRWNTSTSTEDDESTTVRIRVRGSVHDVNGKGLNTGTVTVETAAYGSESWTTRDTRSVDSGAFDYSIYVSGFDTNSRYQARITVTDSFGVTSQTTITIETAQPVLDFRANGKGLAVFGVSTQDGLQVYGNEQVTGSLDVDGSATVDGSVRVNSGIIIGRQESGYEADDRYILIAKSQQIYNADSNYGWVHIRGMIGNWVAGGGGPVDVHIPFRGTISAANARVASWPDGLPVNNIRIVVEADASGYVYVFLRIYNSVYWQYSLELSGYQCDFPFTVYTGLVGEVDRPTSVFFFDSSSFVIGGELFPVGSVVVRYDHISPASIYGGTWARIEGRFLYATGASGTIGATGGSGTHTLTTSQMPAHTHTSSMKVTSTEASGYGLNIADGFKNRVLIRHGGGNDVGGYIANTGGGAAHNNNPAFINVSVWRRTA